MKKSIGIIIIIVGVIIDQISKIIVFNNEVNFTLIPNLLNFTLVKNYGAAFGSFQGLNLALIFVTLTICLLIVLFMINMYKKGEFVSPAYYLILSGGVGNLIDRIFRGFVVDFIDTPFIATFNIADSFIVIGAIWILVAEVMKSLKKTA